MDFDHNDIQIQEIRSGSEKAFEEFYKTYYAQLARFTWRYVQSRAVAEELVQELFADLWQNRKNFIVEGSMRAYLYKSMKNRSLNYLKHQKIKLKYDKEWVSEKRGETMTIPDEEKSREKKIKEELKKSLEALDPCLKTTFKMHRFDGLTYQEIADILDVSVKTVEYRMTKTLKVLRKRLSHLLALMIVIMS